VIAVKARRVTDTMFMAAAKALAGISPAHANPSRNLLPPVSELRDVAVTVALAVASSPQGRADPGHRDRPDRSGNSRQDLTPHYQSYRLQA